VLLKFQKKGRKKGAARGRGGRRKLGEGVTMSRALPFTREKGKRHINQRKERNEKTRKRGHRQSNPSSILLRGEEGDLLFQKQKGGLRECSTKKGAVLWNAPHLDSIEIGGGGANEHSRNLRLTRGRGRRA